MLHVFSFGFQEANYFLKPAEQCHLPIISRKINKITQCSMQFLCDTFNILNDGGFAATGRIT